MELDFETLQRTFEAEADEGLAAMESRLLDLESDPADPEAVHHIFRVVHTLKGDSAALGYRAMSRFAHRLEDVLDALREGSAALTPTLGSLLLDAVDTLRRMLWDGPGDGELGGRDGDQLERIAGEARAALSGDRSARVRSARTGRDRTESGLAAPAGHGTLRVDLERLDRLLDLTGELAIARGRVAVELEGPDGSRSEALELHREQDRLFESLQELVIQLRMVPVGPVFRRFHRAVRDLCLLHGKRARLELSGEGVELDARVVEQLRDPLIHMIRNAIDHGIEAPEVREGQGKPAEGVLRLRSSYQGGSVVLELSDDGAGLDRGRIARKAKELGLLDPAAPVGDAALDRLILAPGLTTSEDVTETSGRGVGMDVVRQKIDSLRGSLAVESRAGAGTRFRIRLPLTLAIIEGFLVGVADETYILPIESIVETVELPPEARGNGRNHGVLRLRGEPLPWVRLRSLLGLAGSVADREKVVIAHHDGALTGLVVDSLAGQSQVVVKRLDPLFEGVPGISGSVILGDGEIALILDVPTLLHRLVEERNPLTAVRKELPT